MASGRKASPACGMRAPADAPRPAGDGVVGRRDALADIAAAVVGAVVLDLEAGDAFLQPRRQRLVDAVHGAERCCRRSAVFEKTSTRLRRRVEMDMSVLHGFPVARLPIGSPFTRRWAPCRSPAARRRSGARSPDRRPVEIRRQLNAIAAGRWWLIWINVNGRHRVSRSNGACRGRADRRLTSAPSARPVGITSIAFALAGRTDVVSALNVIASSRVEARRRAA